MWECEIRGKYVDITRELWLRMGSYVHLYVYINYVYGIVIFTRRFRLCSLTFGYLNYRQANDVLCLFIIVLYYYQYYYY